MAQQNVKRMAAGHGGCGSSHPRASLAAFSCRQKLRVHGAGPKMPSPGPAASKPSPGKTGAQIARLQIERPKARCSAHVTADAAHTYPRPIGTGRNRRATANLAECLPAFPEPASSRRRARAVSWVGPSQAPRWWLGQGFCRLTPTPKSAFFFCIRTPMVTLRNMPDHAIFAQGREPDHETSAHLFCFLLALNCGVPLPRTSLLDSGGPISRRTLVRGHQTPKNPERVHQLLASGVPASAVSADGATTTASCAAPWRLGQADIARETSRNTGADATACRL